MCKGVEGMSVVVNMQGEGRTMKLDHSNEERTHGGVGKRMAAVGCREGSGGREIDLRRTRAKASGERREEAVVGELGLAGEGAIEANGGKGGGGGRWVLWSGVINRDPNVRMEVPDGTRNGCGGE